MAVSAGKVGKVPTTASPTLTTSCLPCWLCFSASPWRAGRTCCTGWVHCPVTVFSDQTHNSNVTDIQLMKLLIISWGSFYHSEMIDWLNDLMYSTSWCHSGTFSISTKDLYFPSSGERYIFCSSFLTVSAFNMLFTLFFLSSCSSSSSVVVLVPSDEWCYGLWASMGVLCQSCDLRLLFRA